MVSVSSTSQSSPGTEGARVRSSAHLVILRYFFHSYLSLLPLTPTSHSYLSQSLTTSHSLSQPLNTSHNLSQPITIYHNLSQPLVTSHILSKPLDSPLTKGLGTQYTHIYHLLPDSTIQSQCGNGGDYFLHIQNYNNKHRPPHDLLSAFWALLTCY